MRDAPRSRRTPSNPGKHKRLYQKAVFIDQFVRAYRKARRRRSFPQKEVGIIIHLLFPKSKRIGQGAFKTAYKVSSRGKHFALKISRPKNIRADMRAYKKLPTTIRNRYFAKIYWRTKYSLLQKLGRKKSVPGEVMRALKAAGKKFGLIDVREDNVRSINGRFKIVDALVSRRKRGNRK